jgi:hypothetical protein
MGKRQRRMGKAEREKRRAADATVFNDGFTMGYNMGYEQGQKEENKKWTNRARK